MYITVYNRVTKDYYNTKFDCRQCVHGDYCRESGYKRNCAFYYDMRPFFRVISQIPYLTTGEPRLIYVNLDGKVSLTQAQLVIETTKRCYTAHTK